MSKFLVDVTEDVTYRITVEADSAEQAEQKATDHYLANDANPEQAGFEYRRGDRDAFAQEV